MFEMLPALASLTPSGFTEFQAALNRRDSTGKLMFVTDGELPRMKYAIDVVRNGEVPDVAPGDLAATGQEKYAMEFLNDDNPATQINFVATAVKFDDLLKNYPTGSPAAAKGKIGGHVDAAWIGNTCAVRLSRSLNYSGLPVPQSQAGLDVVSGADTRWYAYRMVQLTAFVRGQLGSPSMTLSTPPFKRKRFGAMRGIISFDIHFHDANGHIDLWDGSSFMLESAAAHDYFAAARSIVFWRLH